MPSRPEAERLTDTVPDHVVQGSAAQQADVKLRANERIKYTATFVNGVAVTIISVGVAAPVLGLFVPGNAYGTRPLALAEVSGTCVLIAALLHIIVRWMLGKLQA